LIFNCSVKNIAGYETWELSIILECLYMSNGNLTNNYNKKEWRVPLFLYVIKFYRRINAINKMKHILNILIMESIPGNTSRNF